MVEVYDRIIATFQPKRTDDLKAFMAERVGYRGIFECLWEITVDDGGPYVGQHAWRPVEDDWLAPHWGWIPTEDLVNVEEYHG